MNKRPIENHPLFVGDEVLQEVWRVKDARSAARGHDIHGLFEELRKAALARKAKVDPIEPSPKAK
jgi:hypothetical protein